MILPDHKYVNRVSNLFIDKSSPEFLKLNSETNYGLPVDINSMCQSCKNENTDNIIDKVILQEYSYHFVKCKSFKMYHCRCCEAVWFVYKV